MLASAWWRRSASCFSLEATSSRRAMSSILLALILISNNPAGRASECVPSTELDARSQIARRNHRACGPLAVWYALARMGHNEDPEKLIAMAQLTEMGTTIRQLLDITEKVGVPGKAITADRNNLALLPVPSILIVDDGTHCVVYEGIDWSAGTAKIFDPESNQAQALPVERVQRGWTGEAIVFDSPYPSILAFFSLSVLVMLLVAAPAGYLTHRITRPKQRTKRTEPTANSAVGDRGEN
jgi:hypothetical protein